MHLPLLHMILPFAHHIVVLRKWKIYSKVWKAICFRFPAITSDIAPKMYLVWKVSVSPSARVSNIEKPLEWKIRPLRNCQGANYMVICLESRYQTRLKISFHIFISLWSRKLNEDFTKYTRIETSQKLRMLSRSPSDCKSILLNVMIQVSQLSVTVNCVTKSLIH